MPSCLQAKKKLLLFSVVTQCTPVLCRPEAFCVESWKLYKNSGVLFAAPALRLTDGCHRWKIPSRGMACKNIDDHQTRGWWKQVNWKRRLAQKWTYSSDEVARTTTSPNDEITWARTNQSWVFESLLKTPQLAVSYLSTYTSEAS